MSNENHDMDIFDVVKLGSQNERIFMIVSYRGHTHHILNERVDGDDYGYFTRRVQCV